jgi:hypothetical protein
VGQAFTATFDAGASDPAFDFSTGIVNLSTGSLQQGAVLVGLTNAIGTTGTAPNWATQTLNIPLAVTASVTAGLLSKTDYDRFDVEQAEIVLDFAACVSGTAALGWDAPAGDASTAPAAACNDTGSIQRPSADFSGSAVNSVERTIQLPTGWAGNIDIAIRYVSVAATPTGNVEWEIQTICRAVGETWDAAFNAAQTITDAVAAQNVLNDGTQTAVTTTTCAAGEDFSVRVWRDGTNDTNNDLAKALYAKLTVRNTNQ